MHTPTRRCALCGIAGLGALFAHPALAQITSPLDVRGRARRPGERPLTEKDEATAGAKLYGPSIDAMGGAYPNRAAQTALARLAEPIFATSARPEFSWEITIVDSNEVNAWVLPGGKMAVNKGLLRYVDVEDELAAVIAHEMGHAEKSHIIDEQRNRDAGRAIAGLLTAVGTSAAGSDSRVGVGVGLGAANLGILAMVTSDYSRDHEREADRHIAEVFAKTGHSVARGAGFYQTLLELIPENSRGRTSLFAGHPATKERLAALKALATGAPPPLRASPAFAEVKTVFPTRKVYMRS